MTDFRTAEQAIAPNLDSFVGATNPTQNNGTSPLMRVGIFAKGNSKARGIFRFSLDGIAGTDAVAKLRAFVTLSDNAQGGAFSILRIARARAITITSAGVTYAKYDGTNDWTAPGTDTNGAGNDPGHDVVLTNRVSGLALPLNGYEFYEYAIDALVQDQIDEIVANSYTGSDAALGLLLVQDNEAAATTGHGAIFQTSNSTDSLARPQLLLSYKPPGSDDYIMASPSAIVMPGGAIRIFAFLGDYDSFADGDTLVYQVSENEDMSDADELDPIALHVLSEGDLISGDYTYGGAETTLYIRAKATVDGVVSYDSVQTIDLSESPEEMPESDVMASLSANRVGCAVDEAVLRCGTDAASVAGDYAYAIHGRTSGELDQCTDPVALPAGRREPFSVILYNCDVTEREYYRLYIRHGGTLYATPEYQISNTPEDGTTTIIVTSDLHACTAHVEEEGVKELTGFGAAYLPQTYRSQIRDLVYDAMLDERVGDGGRPHAQINLGDWLQTKLATGNNHFPVDENGLTVDGTSSHALSTDDVKYSCAAIARKDPTLRVIPREVLVVGNHEGGHSYFYGNSSGVTGRNTVTDPEISPAEWRMEFEHKFVGLPDGDGIFVSGDPLGRWGCRDYATMRLIWLDAYLFSVLSISDPNTFPQTYDDISDWSLGATQYNYLFDESTGVYRNSTKPTTLIAIHNFTATRENGGPRRYAWSWFDVASPRGTNPNGEWPETIHPALVEFRPANTMVCILTGHKHFLAFERPHDGIFHVSAPRHSGGQDDLVDPGPYSRGHRLSTVNAKSYDEADFLYSSSNAGYLRIDTSAEVTRITNRKIFREDRFSGQLTAIGTPVNPDDVVSGIFNPGPNAITRALVTQYTLSLALPEFPVRALYDSFGDDCTIEDSTEMLSPGTEQPALDPGQINRHITSRDGRHWKCVTTGTGTYLAIRESIIDGARVLSTRRPVAEEAESDLQEIRRAVAIGDRTVSVMVRAQLGDGTGMIIRAGGADVDFTLGAFASPAATGLGVYLVIIANNIVLLFDDGDTVETLHTGAHGLQNETWHMVTVSFGGRSIVVTIDGETMCDIKMTPEQIAWLSDQDHIAWVGVAAIADNMTGRGEIAEFRDFSVVRYSAPGGGRPSMTRPSMTRPSMTRPSMTRPA